MGPWWTPPFLGHPLSSLICSTSSPPPPLPAVWRVPTRSFFSGDVVWAFEMHFASTIGNTNLAVPTLRLTVPNSHRFLHPPYRSTPSMYSSVRVGRTSGWSLRDQCSVCPWITCWPVRYGLRTRSSTMARSPLLTTWPPQTSCSGWSRTVLCSTLWGNYPRISKRSHPIPCALNAERNWTFKPHLSSLQRIFLCFHHITQ